MRRVRWIPNWRDGLRFVSVQCMSAASAIVGTWATIPDDWRARVPENVVLGLVLALLGVGIVGRFVQQALPSRADPPAR